MANPARTGDGHILLPCRLGPADTTLPARQIRVAERESSTAAGRTQSMALPVDLDGRRQPASVGRRTHNRLRRHRHGTWVASRNDGADESFGRLSWL
jgi:hypothetical protein